MGDCCKVRKTSFISEIVVEVEVILNSRPLTPLTNDSNNLEALTSGHFLVGEALTSQVDSRVYINTVSLEINIPS